MTFASLRKTSQQKAGSHPSVPNVSPSLQPCAFSWLFSLTSLFCWLICMNASCQVAGGLSERLNRTPGGFSRIQTRLFTSQHLLCRSGAKPMLLTAVQAQALNINQSGEQSRTLIASLPPVQPNRCLLFRFCSLFIFEKRNLEKTFSFLFTFVFRNLVGSCTSQTVPV